MKVNYVKDVVRRSRLIMPAHVEKYIKKAYLRNADAIVLDLEDSVPSNLKEQARSVVKDSILEVGKGGSDVFVRVNNEEEYLVDDITASVWPGLEGIYLPKVETPESIHDVESLLEKLEKERGIEVGSLKISVIIETCLGYLNMQAIAQSSDRIDSITIGNEDFFGDLGVISNDDTYYALLTPKFQLVVTAKAYNKIPMGLIGSLANYQDENAFEKSAIRAYQLGYLGASCINPTNVETLNRSFTPTEEEVEHALGIKEAFEAGVSQGRASVNHNGKMIDIAHYKKASQLLERYETIRAFDKKKQEARDKFMEVE